MLMYMYNKYNTSTVVTPALRGFDIGGRFRLYLFDLLQELRIYIKIYKNNKKV